MPAFAAGRRILAALHLVLVTALATSLLATPSADASLTLRQRKIHRGVEVALNQKGDPYRYGAAGPDAFDCSGLTKYSFGKAGLYLPRTSRDQYRFVRHIKKRNLRRGDLMFFHSGGRVYHVAIFLGRSDGHVWLLHASRTGTPVKRDPVWTTSWYAGTLRRRG